VVILDEAHNVEKMCEESVSVRIRSTDVALCIQEITQVRKRQRISEVGIFMLLFILLGFSVWNVHRVMAQKFFVYM
jgi:Rad3-related DNA helicase